MEIDFVKWLCGKSGYHLEKGHYPEGFWLHYKENFNIRLDDELFKDSPMYRDFLQRSIEGVEENLNLEVLAYKSRKVNGYTFQVFTAVPADDFPRVEMWGEGCLNVNQAKEEALKYIFKQENN